LHVGRRHTREPASGCWRESTTCGPRLVHQQRVQYVREFEDQDAKFAEVRAKCVALSTRRWRWGNRHTRPGLYRRSIVPSFTFVATEHALCSGQKYAGYSDDMDPRSTRGRGASGKTIPRAPPAFISGVNTWGRPCASGVRLIAVAANLRFCLTGARFGFSHKGKASGGFGRCERFSSHATKLFIV